MHGFRALRHPRYWAKFFAIAIWSMVICTYIWFFSYLGGSNPTPGEKWIQISISVIIGGVGLSYLEKLYIVPYERFSFKPIFSILMIVFGAAGIIMGLGIYEELKETFAWQVAGAVYTMFCFAAFVYGFSQDKRELPHNQ